MSYHKTSNPEQLHDLLDAVLSIGSGLELDGVLRRVTRAACHLTGARYGALGVLDPSGEGLSRFIHVGMDDETVERIGHLPAGKGILGLLIVDARPLRLRDLRTHPDSAGFPAGHPPMSSFLGVPLRVQDEVFGNLYLTEKKDKAAFDDDDEALVVELAAAAAIAIDNARLHARLAHLGVVADRDRIARDLHDTVIQRIFATGLSLQSLLPLASDPELRNRLEEAVSELDDTIRQVRTAIFSLEPPRATRTGLCSQIIEISTEAARSLGFDPQIFFQGVIDQRVDDHVASELLASLREALSNVARHAQASSAKVEVSAMDDDLRLLVADDGVGFASSSGHGKGLPNMAERAEALGGSFSLRARPTGGTELLWQVPIVPPVAQKP